jgi:septum formation protein
MSAQPDPASLPARLVLASASPRRRRLFEWYDVSFSVCSTDVDETPAESLAGDPRAQAAEIAERKALAAASGEFGRDVVIGCDTMVVLDGQVLGKPVDVADAHRMRSRRPASRTPCCSRWPRTSICTSSPTR